MERREMLSGGKDGGQETPMDVDYEAMTCKIERSPNSVPNQRERSNAHDIVVPERSWLRVRILHLIQSGIASDLETKSSIMMEDVSVNEFRVKILDGDYNRLGPNIKALNLTQELQLTVEYLLFEQQFLELLSKKQMQLALKVLRDEITPRSQNSLQLHNLSLLLMCPTTEKLMEQAKWKGPDHKGRKALLEKIQAIVPPTCMLPPRRLESLMKQSLAYQISQCKYHNTHLDKYSLLVNHQCSQMLIPTNCVSVLRQCQDEVWDVKFSNTGRFLASLCKDRSIHIWSIKEEEKKLKVKWELELCGHEKSLLSLNWSNNSDRFLLSTGQDQKVKVWDLVNHKMIASFGGHNDIVHAASFCMDDEHVVSVGVDKNIILWRLVQDDSGTYQTQEISKTHTTNFMDIVLTKSRLVVLGCNHDIQIYSFDLRRGGIITEPSGIYPQKEVSSITTPQKVFSFRLSKDGKYLLCNMSFQEPVIAIYDLDTLQLVHKYSGHKQNVMVIKTTFGGANDSLVASGSEDMKIYIWHRDKEERLAVLEGHSANVNAVHWSPSNSYLFASASDDKTVRLWSVEGVQCEVISDIKERVKVDLFGNNDQSKVQMMMGRRYGEFEDDEIEEEEEEDEDENEVLF